MTSLSTTAARWVEPGVLLLALTAIAQNVLSVKASLWTLTHLRYSQINSHPHSRGHEATVIWLTPSHMYTHTHKHVCKHNLLIVPGVGLEKPRTCSLSLSLGLSWPTSLLKGFVPHFYPHHSFMKHLFQRVAGSLLCQVCFLFVFPDRWLGEKPSNCEWQRVFSLLLTQILPEHWGRSEAKTFVQVRAVSFVTRLSLSAAKREDLAHLYSRKRLENVFFLFPQRRHLRLVQPPLPVVRLVRQLRLCQRLLQPQHELLPAQLPRYSARVNDFCVVLTLSLKFCTFWCSDRKKLTLHFKNRPDFGK